MKNQILKSLTIGFAMGILAVLFSGCTVVGGIFKTGYWVGILTVVLVLGVILFVTLRISNSGTEHKS